MKHHGQTPVVVRPREPEKLAKSAHPFIKRHKRAVSILGVVIVFATFVAKEILGDRYKQKLDALEAAEAVFDVRDDTQSILEKIQNQPAPLPSGPPSKQPVNPTTLDGRMFYWGTTTGFEFLGLKKLALVLESTKNLASKLSYHDGEYQKVQESIKELDDNRNELERLSIDLAKTSSQRTLTDTEKQGFLDKLTANHNAGNELTDKIFEQRDEIKKYAYDERELLAHLYDRAKYASYILYTIGSFLTVLGIAMGIDSARPEAE
jgi:hypothetical protein